MRLARLLTRLLAYVMAAVACGLALAAFCDGRPGAAAFALGAGGFFFLTLLRDCALELQPMQDFEGQFMD